MTENKRFVLYEHKGAEYILDTPNTELDFIEMLGDCLDEKEIVDLLNELSEENEQLKADNNRLVNETAKVVAEHQRKVFKLIDEKIDELEGRYKFGQEVYKGCPMHNIRFGINVLKELKRELQE